MGRPFNAGVAASNGVEAAQLAKRGFVSCDDGVGGPRGFIDAHVDGTYEDAAWASPPPCSWCPLDESALFGPERVRRMLLLKELATSRPKLAALGQVARSSVGRKSAFTVS